MIEWSTEIPNSKDTGQYLVVSKDTTTNTMRADIEWWDGYCWDNIDKRNDPIKWVKIDY